MAKSFYTFSKDIEEVQLDNNTQRRRRGLRNLSLERGRSDNDRRHVMVSSLIWNMDYFGNQAAWCAV